MHKRKQMINLKIISIFLFILLFSLISASQFPVLASIQSTNSETGYGYYLDDAADFFTEQQEASLCELMFRLTNYCNVALATSTDHPYHSSEQFAVKIYENTFGNGSNGVCFVIDRDLNKIYLISEGKNQKTISSSRCSTITDNTYVYATSSYNYDYYTCARKTFEQVLTLLEGGKIAQPMKYICNVLLALVLAMLVNYFIVQSLAHAKKPSNSELMSGIYSNIEIFHPSATFTHQTKRYEPRSSSSGGSGSSGGGGGHSGGGHSI